MGKKIILVLGAILIYDDGTSAENKSIPPRYGTLFIFEHTTIEELWTQPTRINSHKRKQ